MIEDIDRIMAVMTQAFDPHWGEAWNRRQIADALALPATGYLLASADGGWPAEGEATAGFALIRQTLDEAELLLIGVVPQQRGRGLGRRLLEQAIAAVRDEGAARLFLEMRDNNPAVHLYRAVGFEQVGRRPAYYRLADGSRLDALTLALAI